MVMDVMHVVTDEHDTEGYPESRRPGKPFCRIDGRGPGRRAGCPGGRRVRV